MDIQIEFPGGVAVAAEVHGHRVLTDQPVSAGGGNTAPAPFDLFLASLGTCAGLYALRFCQQREIATEGLAVALHTERDLERHRLSAVRIELTLPPGFPERYRAAIVRAVDQCAVKRTIFDPPEFEIALEPAPADSALEQVSVH